MSPPVQAAGFVTPLHRPDWNTRRLKFLFVKKNRSVVPDDGIVTAFRDGVVTLRTKRREEGFTMADKEIGYQGVEPGDLVIHAMDGFAGAIGVSDSRGKCSPVCTIAIPKSGSKSAHTRFWAYYLRSLASSGFIQSLAKGIRERSTDFRWGDASNLLVNFPDYDTQESIAAFLDHETARIDQLIGKKQQMATLLSERRGMAVLACLSEGLSGFSWQPENQSVAFQFQKEGWAAIRVKGLVSFMTSGSRGWSSLLGTEGEAFIQSGNIGRHMEVDLDSAQRVKPQVGAEADRTLVKKSDVLVCITGGRTGAVGYIRSIEGRAYINQHVCLLRARPRIVLPELLAHILWSEIGQKQIGLCQYGVKQGVGFNEVANLQIPVPPAKLQPELVKRIQAQTARLDQLTRAVQQSIDRLHELRSALITAAVTGRVDILTWQKRGLIASRLHAVDTEVAN